MDKRDLDSVQVWNKDRQCAFWNQWIEQNLSGCPCDPQAVRRGETVLNILRGLELGNNATILEVGCATGWFTSKLTALGEVVGVDIAEGAIEQARNYVPDATFYSGDFLTLPLPQRSFDIVVSLETFAHVPQTEFVDRVADLLKPGGYLVLTTQNRYVYMRMSWVKRPAEGQLRRWVTTKQLRQMVRSKFEVKRCFTIEPGGHLGVLRIVNSRRLSALAGLLIGSNRLKSIKERFGLGQTIVLCAELKT